MRIIQNILCLKKQSFILKNYCVLTWTCPRDDGAVERLGVEIKFRLALAAHAYFPAFSYIWDGWLICRCHRNGHRPDDAFE